MFVPAPSVEGKKEKILFSWVLISKFVIFPQIFPCSNYGAMKYSLEATEFRIKYTPVSWTILLRGNIFLPCAYSRGIFSQGECYCTNSTLCSGSTAETKLKKSVFLGHPSQHTQIRFLLMLWQRILPWSRSYLSVNERTNIRCDYNIIMIIIIRIIMKVIENVHLMMIMMILTGMMMTLITIFVPILLISMLQVKWCSCRSPWPPCHGPLSLETFCHCPSMPPEMIWHIRENSLTDDKLGLVKHLWAVVVIAIDICINFFLSIFSLQKFNFPHLALVTLHFFLKHKMAFAKMVEPGNLVRWWWWVR